MLVGKREMGILMYSKQSRGVMRYMFLMLAPAKHALGIMLMVLFQRSLDDTMLVVRVVSSKG